MANTLTNGDMLNNVNAWPTGLRTTVVAGTTSATNIAVANISTSDKVLSCMQMLLDAVTAANINKVDLTAECSITSAGNVQLSTTDTTDTTLIVEWYDKA